MLTSRPKTKLCVCVCAVSCAAAAALRAQRPDMIVGFDMVGEEWMPFGVEQSTYYYISQYLQLPEVGGGATMGRGALPCGLGCWGEVGMAATPGVCVCVCMCVCGSLLNLRLI
jgi:hypothetical protein